MSESANEDPDYKEKAERTIEMQGEDIKDYKRGFALVLKMIDEIIYRLKASHGRLDRESLRTFLHNVSDAKELAIAMSPMEDYTKVRTNTFNCRACKKVVWDDGTAVRYCPGCIRSTIQERPGEVSQGNEDSSSPISE